ncbi:hypothetical protein [Ruegeria conchae]|uniref:Flp family type IVb pilin n=1 Tax=Ruegeria conchae TaxID=981384 RepID=UPI0029C9A075|nr:hypothetical protein [Ruegeria conchae]
MLKLYVKMKTMARDESGATIVEYGVALTIVAALGTGVLVAVSGDVLGQFTAADNLMP